MSVKKEIGNALWWIGTLDLVFGLLVLLAVFIFAGSAGKFLGFLAAMLLFSALMWALSAWLGGAVWLPWKGKNRAAAGQP